MGEGLTSSPEKDDYMYTSQHQHYQMNAPMLFGGSQGDDVDEEAEEDEDEQYDELDERNDVYTAKGDSLPVPPGT